MARLIAFACLSGKQIIDYFL